MGCMCVVGWSFEKGLLIVRIDLGCFAAITHAQLLTNAATVE